MKNEPEMLQNPIKIGAGEIPNAMRRGGRDFILRLSGAGLKVMQTQKDLQSLEKRGGRQPGEVFLFGPDKESRRAPSFALGGSSFQLDDMAESGFSPAGNIQQRLRGAFGSFVFRSRGNYGS